MKRKLAWLLLALTAACSLWGLRPRPPLHEGLSFSQAVYDRHGRLLRLTATADGKFRLWLPLRDISPLMVRATILQEDQHFRRHPGANPVALIRAAWMTYVVGPRRVGGSTITMQLARLKYGLSSKTPRGKLTQLRRAFGLELFYSKDEILEAYLNLAPYGGNIEGVGAASLIYFDKNADQLNLSEALTLSVIPQNPLRRTLAGRANPRDQSARWSARRSLWARWLRLAPEDSSQANAIDFTPERRRPAVPFEAPHFTDRLLKSRREGRVSSTLDWGLQKLVERIAKSYLERKRALGLKNAAALLLDYRTMEVLAELGSANYQDASISGQVNGTSSRRSPGSTLKPFVYGLAFQEGLIHPQSMLKDAPMAFGAFDPENFDGDFVGPVKAREALIKSRNVPAVALSSQLKAPGLYGFLKEAGVALPKPAGHYGLGLALGGCETTMGELAGLYAMLARGGEARPLRRVLGEPEGASKRLLSREASFLVMDILKDSPRPRQGFAADWTRSPAPVFWKTGTSFAFRDAWTVGVFGSYALAVWIGDFGGEGNPAFVGAEAAAPLFFEIVDAVRARPSTPEDPYAKSLHGLNVSRVEVCAVSGKLPGASCPRKTGSWFIPGVSPISACDVHRAVLVDRKSGLRLCAPGPSARSETFEFWPSDLLKVFRQAGLPRRQPPDFHPSCGLASKGHGLPPKIDSPLGGVSYALRPGAEDSIAFTAVTDADAAWLYWFVDERLVGKTLSGKALFWKPEPGRFMVRVVDDQGRSDTRELSVAMAD